MKTSWISVFLILALTLAGCASNPGAQPEEPQRSPTVSEPTLPTGLPTFISTKVLGDPSFPTVSPEPPITGAITAMPTTSDPNAQRLVNLAIQDLAKRLAVQPDQIQLMQATEVTWSNSSLGCPQDGIMYSEVLTPGYLILLEHAGRTFEYHASRGDTVVTCENPLPPVPGSPGNT